ncbi:MAG TPA: nucleoid-associated protein, YbaB/EbfC family [Clostridiales bacterium]|nr:nucleoid-associated protein, YbaB/EbfC family [Clostridiales bacterium]
MRIDGVIEAAVADVAVALVFAGHERRARGDADRGDGEVLGELDAFGGGAVKVVVNGNKEFKSIEISPAAVDPDDVEMLQDLILSAVNEAVRLANETMEKEMSKVTGGLGNLGGFGF